jgi:hypothetical protein
MTVVADRGQEPVAHDPNGDGLYRQERQERQERPGTADLRGTATSSLVTFLASLASLALLAVSVVAVRRLRQSSGRGRSAVTVMHPDEQDDALR